MGWNKRGAWIDMEVLITDGHGYVIFVKLALERLLGDRREPNSIARTALYPSMFSRNPVLALVPWATEQSTCRYLHGLELEISTDIRTLPSDCTTNWKLAKDWSA